MTDLALLILRLGLGAIFTAHGLQKAFGMFSRPGVEGFSGMLSGLGFSPALFWAYVAAYTELICGLLLIIGLFTRPAAALLLVLILVAIYKVHLSKGLFLSNGGFEYTLLIACVCIALIILGAGKFGITDRF